MFCYKCGAKLPADSEFCFKCGSKTIKENIEQNEEPKTALGITETTLPVHEGPATLEPTPRSVYTETVKEAVEQRETSVVSKPVVRNTKNEFIKYLDKIIRRDTGLYGASSLLNTKVHANFAWLGYTVPAIILLILGVVRGIKAEQAPILILAILIIGYLFSYIASIIIKANLEKKFSFSYKGKTNSDSLINFLNSHLSHLDPYFDNWFYIKTTGFGLRGAISAAAENASNALSKTVRIGSYYRGKSKYILQITIKQIDNGTSYVSGSIKAESRIRGLHFIGSYKTMVKAAPIIKTALEYYFRIYNNADKAPSIDDMLSENNLIDITPRKFKLKFVSILCIIGTLAAAAVFAYFNIFSDALNMNNPIYAKQKYLQSLAVGEYFTLGTYEQDNRKTNGPEDIEWLVLDKNNREIFAVSKHALDCKPFCTSQKFSATWDKSTLRQWLNGEFLDTAFSGDEQKMILESTVSADENPYFSTSPGNDTKDKVFILSYLEYTYYLNPRDEGLVGTGSCTATKYAFGQGIKSYDRDFCMWWLRTPGAYTGVLIVGMWGGVMHSSMMEVLDTDIDANEGGIGVRPAIRIKI